MASETPHPFMEKSILNFHVDYWNPSLSASYEASEFGWQMGLNFLQHLRPCYMYDPYRACDNVNVNTKLNANVNI